MGSKYISAHTGTQIDDAVAKKHVHDNKTILDAVTEPFTLEDRAYLNELLQTNVTVDNVITVTNKVIDDITNRIGADHIHYKVRNDTGVVIPEGTVVTGSSTQTGTDYILVEPITDAENQVAIGIVKTELVNNAIGLVVNTGVLADTIDTTSWNEGDILYPSNTSGLTNVKPTTGHYQACALVTRVHQTQGTLLVEFTSPVEIASTTKAGIVQLNDTLTSVSTTEALTANQGKVLKDLIDTLQVISGYVGSKEVDETNITNGSILVYDATLDKVVYTDVIDSGPIV